MSERYSEGHFDYSVSLKRIRKLNESTQGFLHVLNDACHIRAPRLADDYAQCDINIPRKKGKKVCC